MSKSVLSFFICGLYFSILLSHSFSPKDQKLKNQIKERKLEEENMSSMKLEVKVISASRIGKKNVFAKLYIDDDPSTEKQTPVEPRGKWNHTVAYPINRLDVKDNCTKLIIRVCSKQMVGEEFIGEVNVKFKELFKKAGRKRKTVKYKLRNGLGKSKGKLKFSYKFLEDRGSAITCGCMTMAMLKIATLGLGGNP